MSSDFYTYAYLRKNGTPYYIGKGKNNRAFEKHKGVHVPPKERVLFLKKNLTEQKAFDHEVYMIAVLGRKDLKTGILHNRTNGGEGSSGCIPTEETRQRMSEASRNRSEETRRKISEANRRRVLTPETRKKISESKKDKPLKITNENRSKRVSNSNRGRKWFVNSLGERRFTYDYPGEDWQRGKTWKEFQ